MKKVLLIFIFVLMLGISSPIFAANQQNRNYYGPPQTKSYSMSRPGKKYDNGNEKNAHLKEKDFQRKQDGLECNCDGCRKPPMPLILQVAWIAWMIYIAFLYFYAKRRRRDL